MYEMYKSRKLLQEFWKDLFFVAVVAVVDVLIIIVSVCDVTVWRMWHFTLHTVCSLR